MQRAIENMKEIYLMLKINECKKNQGFNKNYSFENKIDRFILISVLICKIVLKEVKQMMEWSKNIQYFIFLWEIELLCVKCKLWKI